jgi:tyrosyl-tRNA synthetase
MPPKNLLSTHSSASDAGGQHETLALCNSPFGENSVLRPVDLNQLARTTDKIFSLEELRRKLAMNRPLRIKYGVDVTAPFLHIGHAINLWMMRHFQECGHKLVFLIGDFTTRIGDPTGKHGVRVPPSLEDIQKNADEFIRQVGQIVLTEPDVFEVRRNSEWFGSMPVSEFLSLLSLVTHSRLIQRDMFQRRIEMGSEIFIHEMLYPILQGYDSVMLQSDLTIVGSDQLFNELMGRFYQEKFNQSPQVVITTKITAGTDGKQKQSKSLGNYIALADTPRDKFGKIMSIPDELIVPYLEVYTSIPMAEVNLIRDQLASQKAHPMAVKKQLARSIVERYHGSASAAHELQWFTETFSERKRPTGVTAIAVAKTDTVIDVLQKCMPTASRSQLRRLLKQGAVKLNEERLREEQVDSVLLMKDDDIIKLGKTGWFKISRC